MSSKLYSNSWTPGLFLLPRRNSCQAENKFSREIISSKTLWKILHLTPPPDASKFNVPLVHKVCEFYKKIYSVSPRIPKRDRFGIYLKIENICLEIIDLIITASLEIKINKLLILNSARIKIEVLKENGLALIKDGFKKVCKEKEISANVTYIGNGTYFVKAQARDYKMIEKYLAKVNDILTNHFSKIGTIEIKRDEK